MTSHRAPTTTAAAATIFASTALALPAWLILALPGAAWTITLGLFVLRRAPWARWAAVATFSFFAAVNAMALLLAGLTGSFSDGALFALSGAGASAAVALLVVRQTARDFDRSRRRPAAPASGMPYGSWSASSDPAPSDHMRRAV